MEAEQGKVITIQRVGVSQPTVLIKSVNPADKLIRVSLARILGLLGVHEYDDVHLSLAGKSVVYIRSQRGIGSISITVEKVNPHPKKLF